MRAHLSNNLGVFFLKSYVESQKFVALLLHQDGTLSSDQISWLEDFYTKQGRESCFEMIRAAKIIPFGAHILSKLGIDSDFWERKHNDYYSRNEEIYKKLSQVFEDITKEGCYSLCLMENFAVLLRSKSCLSCFCSGDVDLTADIDERNTIEQIFIKHGFIKDTRRNNVEDKMTNYYNHSFLEGGFWINIMWKPIARRLLLDQRRITKRFESARNHASTIKSSSIRVLENTELMYFSLLHIASSHFYTLTPGMRLYTDIDRLARNCLIDWSKIPIWSKIDKIGLRTDLVLSICSDILNTPIPSEAYNSQAISPTFVKLKEYLIRKEDLVFFERSGKLHRLYVEFLSDDVNLGKALINRILRV